MTRSVEERRHAARQRTFVTSTALVWIAAGAIAIAPLDAARGRPLDAARGRQEKADPGRQVARLEAGNAELEKQIALAAGKEFYLVLDPVAKDLALMLRGAELRRYPVIALSIGAPRVAFVRRRANAAWQGVIFSGGRLDPPREIDRLEIAPPPDALGPSTGLGAGPSTGLGAGPSTGLRAGETKPVIPPTPEELFPVPLRYHVRFERGPSIEVRPREADPSSRWARFATWWGARWRDTLAALRPAGDEIVRLRIVLAPEDADTLYRSLPPGVKLLVRATAGM